MPVTYSCTDNILLPIPVSDWLIFCCGNAIKKGNEIDKNKHFLMKNKKMPKNFMEIWCSNLSYELTLLTRDVTCSKLWRCRENIGGDKKLSVEQTLIMERKCTNRIKLSLPVFNTINAFWNYKKALWNIFFVMLSS